MTRPRVTTGLLVDGEAPRCPHCAAYMDDAQVPLGMLLNGWPIPQYVPAESDGFAHPRENLMVDCPECGRASYLAIDGVKAKLVAARTTADIEYIVEHWGPRHASSP